MNKGGRPKNQVTKQCIICLCSFSVRKSMSDSKYCSHPCYWKSKVGKPSWFRGKKRISQSGENHHYWKGNKVSYRSLHRWVERQIGKPNQCRECKKNGHGHQIHWANVSGKYRRELSDWIRLCAKCHGAFDKINVLRKNTKV